MSMTYKEIDKMLREMTPGFISAHFFLGNPSVQIKHTSFFDRFKKAEHVPYENLMVDPGERFVRVMYKTPDVEYTAIFYRDDLLSIAESVPYNYDPEIVTRFSEVALFETIWKEGC